MKADIKHIRVPIILIASSIFLISGAYAANLRAQDLIGLEAPPAIMIESGKEKSLPIKITRKDAITNQSMVLIRGVPETVALTNSRLFPSGVWAIKPSALSEVRVITAPGTETESQIDAAIATLDGKTVSRVSSRLIIIPAPSLEQETAGTSETLIGQEDPVYAAIAPRKLTSAEEEKVEILIRRGDQNFSEGKINAARLLYQKAAEIGSAEAALAVARTYDSVQLSRFTIVGGVEPNAELAKQWYETALSLGAKLAGTVPTSQ